MATAGHRIGLVGATGALGSEVLAVLDRSSIRVAEVVPYATDDSLGQDIEFQGSVYPVRTESPRLAGLDLLFVCTPPDAALEMLRETLRAEVPAVDLSGALAFAEEVPLRVAALGAAPDATRAPVLAAPAGPALVLSMVLRPLAEAAGLRRVVATVLESASVGGKGGIQTIYAESLAVFNQDDMPEPEVFERPVAFDCVPVVGASAEGGATQREAAVAGNLKRLLGSEPAIAVTVVQVPTFVGQGVSLAVESERPLDPVAAEKLLDEAPGVELWREDDSGPTTRSAAGSETVLVGRVRSDPSSERGLLLWLAADALSVAAANAVALAEARLRA